MNYIAIPGLKSDRSTIAAVQGPSDRVSCIISAVEKYFNVPMERMHARTRRRDICYARQVCMYLLYKRTNTSLKAIGEMFDRDHTSVMHAREHVMDLMDTELQCRQDILLISERI